MTTENTEQNAAQFAPFIKWMPLGIGQVGMKCLEMLRLDWPGFAYYAFDAEAQTPAEELVHGCLAARRFAFTRQESRDFAYALLKGEIQDEVPAELQAAMPFLSDKDYVVLAAALDSEEEALLFALLGYLARQAGVRLVNAAFLRPIHGKFASAPIWAELERLFRSIFDAYSYLPFSTPGTESTLGLPPLNWRPSCYMLGRMLRPLMAFDKYPHLHPANFGNIYEAMHGRGRAAWGFGVGQSKWRCADAVRSAIQSALAQGLRADAVEKAVICLSTARGDIEGKELHFAKATAKKLLELESEPLILDFYDDDLRPFVMEASALLLAPRHSGAQ